MPLNNPGIVSLCKGIKTKLSNCMIGGIDVFTATAPGVSFYVTENGLNFYVTEDGANNYVTESS